MIWKPKLATDEEVKNYSAPSLLRQYKETNKWCTTNQTTYKNYYVRNQQPLSSHKPVYTNNERLTSSKEGLQRDQLLSQQKNSRLESRQGKITCFSNLIHRPF